MAKFSKKLNITLLLFVVLSTILIVVSCGGSDSSFINTNQNVNTPVSFTYTPTPVLTSVPINAYLYLSNTSLEDGENVEQTTVLDIPAVNPDSSASTPLLTQLSALQQENPQDWQGEDMKELSDKLSATLNQSQALPETAKVFSKYQDSLNESPIPVNNEGYISGQAVVGDTDTNVQLEVSLDEDHYIDAETIIPSNNLTSSDATGATLKSCPEKVFVLPGEVIIIQITSTTGINLKESGLSFSLKNPNLGCITSKPIFLEICGKKKYEKAYCLFYAKKNLTTPIDTLITAKTANGLQLEIFTEIIKSCASISGKVFTTGGKPLIKGYVKSIGSKAFCKLDSSGSYTLPRVFCGHFRKVVTTYWIEDNNKKIRHREEKIIDFFNSNLTNFNFGEEPTPTPTSTPSATPTPREVTDSFYFDMSMDVMMQRDLWSEDLGVEQSVQKTVQWLNGNLDYPKPEGIAQAKVDDYDHTAMWIKFTDGSYRYIPTYPIIAVNNLNSQNSIEKQYNKKIYNNLSDKATTVGSDKIKILSPFVWQNYANESVYDGIWRKLITVTNKDSRWKITTRADIYKVFDLYTVHYITLDSITKITNAFIVNGQPPLTEDQLDNLNQCKDKQEFKTIDSLRTRLCGVFGVIGDVDQIQLIWDNMAIKKYWKMKCRIKNPENIIRPEDFQDLANYGIIYVDTHGDSHGIACGPIYSGDTFLRDNGWLKQNDAYNTEVIESSGTWYIGSVTLIDPESPDPNIPCIIETYSLSKNFFNTKCTSKDFSSSLVYINACNSFNFITRPNNPFKNAKVYLGYSKITAADWARDISYYFFLYLIEGYKKPIKLFPEDEQFDVSDPTPFPSQNPMSVQKAMETLSKVKSNVSGKAANPDPHPYLNDPSVRDSELKYVVRDPNEEIYFPVPVTITVEKK